MSTNDRRDVETRPTPGSRTELSEKREQQIREREEAKRCVRE